MSNIKLLFSFVYLTIIITNVRSQCWSENDQQLPSPDAKTKLYKNEIDFTLRLLDNINAVNPNGNVFFSPYSIFHAVLLAYFGANGQTEQNVRNLLRLDTSSNKINIVKAYRHEKQSRLHRSPAVEFSSADKIYITDNLRVTNCFNDFFHDEVENLNFGTDPEGCRIKINDWVSNITRGHIRDILPPQTIQSSTQLVLANAAYFKGTWQTKFDQETTTKQLFYVTSDRYKFVDMMTVKGNFYYSANEQIGAHILEMPYEGQEVSMYVILPPIQNGLESVIRKLNVDNLVASLDEGGSREVNVTIPKFTFEKQVELRPILERMGGGDLFSSSANLTGFTGTKLLLDDAIHKSKIQVDEEGSTAASATVLFSFRSSRPLETVQFNCNHPFFFFIYDSKSKAILFSGIYRDPDN